MVIIEVNREYKDFDRILGEHRWSEFLRTPTKEEKGKLTQVFYCAYNTGRIVQKNGGFGIYEMVLLRSVAVQSFTLASLPFPSRFY
jgi:hypothetical protein